MMFCEYMLDLTIEKHYQSIVVNPNKRIMIIYYNVKKILVFSLFFLVHFNTISQNINSCNKTLNVFIDCQFCDSEYFLEEIKFVNHVRDTKDADVHILITSQIAANKGEEFSFFFYGLRAFNNMNDTLIFSSNSDDTEYEIRKTQTKIIKMGLIYYLSHNQDYNYINITSIKTEKKVQVINDKWNSWVFDININGFFKDETSFRNISSWSNISAERVTKELKIELKGHYDFATKEYIINNKKHITFNKAQLFSSLIVKSINEHWSYGLKIDASNSTFKNFRLNSNISPAIEYNMFKYSQSTQKQLRFLLFSGYNYFYYNDTTIYDKMEEGFFNENLEIAYEMKQKWGNISIAFIGSVYIPDYSKYLLSFNTNSKIRIIKGLSLQLKSGMSLIHNQIYIPKSELSLEDILTKQKQQETNHLFWIKIGLSFTFGSKYNNIVNPRFGK